MYIGAGELWTYFTQVYSLAGPLVMLLYPLCASAVAIESPSQIDDKQWLAYWILYSLLTLIEILFHPILQWLGMIWYTAKLALVVWMVWYKGATIIYESYVSNKVKKYVLPAAAAFKEH